MTIVQTPTSNTSIFDTFATGGLYFEPLYPYLGTPVNSRNVKTKRTHKFMRSRYNNYAYCPYNDLK